LSRQGYANRTRRLTATSADVKIRIVTPFKHCEWMINMVNENRLTENFIGLTAIDSESGGETAMRNHLTGALARLGIAAGI